MRRLGGCRSIAGRRQHVLSETGAESALIERASSYLGIVQNNWHGLAASLHRLLLFSTDGFRGSLHREGVLAGVHYLGLVFIIESALLLNMML